MRIIKLDTVERKVKCNYCNSIIGYFNSETDSGIRGRYIRCPVCDSAIWVNKFDKKVK